MNTTSEWTLCLLSMLHSDLQEWEKNLKEALKFTRSHRYETQWSTFTGLNYSWPITLSTCVELMDFSPLEVMLSRDSGVIPAEVVCTVVPGRK